MLSVTPSKLTDYLTCPHKYKLKHINKIGDASYSAALAFGQSMHSALQDIHQSNRNLNDFVEVSELLSRYWNAGAYASTEEDETYFLKGCQALKNYCSAYNCDKETTLGTEVYMSYILKIGSLQARMGCKADRICAHRNDVLEIVDYKTNSSGKVPTLESLQKDLPTFLYYALARVTYPEYKCVRISFLNVLTLAKVSVEYDFEQVAANKQNLFECLRNLDSKTFAPTLSEACSWCAFQDSCPAFGKVVDFDRIV